MKMINDVVYRVHLERLKPIYKDKLLSYRIWSGATEIPLLGRQTSTDRDDKG